MARRSNGSTEPTPSSRGGGLRLQVQSLPPKNCNPFWLRLLTPRSNGGRNGSFGRVQSGTISVPRTSFRSRYVPPRAFLDVWWEKMASRAHQEPSRLIGTTSCGQRGGQQSPRCASTSLPSRAPTWLGTTPSRNGNGSLPGWGAHSPVDRKSGRPRRQPRR